MSVITYSENSQSLLVPFEDGMALADFNRPQEESLKWTYSLGKLPAQQIVIVGLGGGFHVQALAEMDPTLKITVIECRDGLISRFKKQNPELAGRVDFCVLQNANDIFSTCFFSEVVNEKPLVISFFECWGSQKETFHQVFSHLTGRSVESLHIHLQEHGMTVKALFNPSVELLSIKDISSHLDFNKNAYQDIMAIKILEETIR